MKTKKTEATHIEIEQSYQYRDNDWWDWEVHLNGPAEELKNVSSVVYQLHNTFPKPVREVSTRRNRFKLKTSGWGNFKIYARVKMKDGSARVLEHDLELRYPDGTLTDK